MSSPYPIVLSCHLYPLPFPGSCCTLHTSYPTPCTPSPTCVSYLFICLWCSILHPGHCHPPLSCCLHLFASIAWPSSGPFLLGSYCPHPPALLHAQSLEVWVPKGFRAPGLQDRNIGALGLHSCTRGFHLARIIIFSRLQVEKGFGLRAPQTPLRDPGKCLFSNDYCSTWLLW